MFQEKRYENLRNCLFSTVRDCNVVIPKRLAFICNRYAFKCKFSLGKLAQWARGIEKKRVLCCL